VVPSVLSKQDCAQLVQAAVKCHRLAVVLADTIVTTREFINGCSAPFEMLMEDKAIKVRALIMAGEGSNENLSALV